MLILLSLSRTDQMSFGGIWIPEKIVYVCQREGEREMGRFCDGNVPHRKGFGLGLNINEGNFTIIMSLQNI